MSQELPPTSLLKKDIKKKIIQLKITFKNKYFKFQTICIVLILVIVINIIQLLLNCRIQ